MSKYSSFIKAISAGVVLFAGVYIAGTFVPVSITAKYSWFQQVGMKLMLALVSIGCALVFKIPLRQAFAIKKNFNRKPTMRLAMYGLLLGMVATTIMLLGHIPALDLLKNMSFPQLILVAWIWSSICEEVFARGLVQSIAGRRPGLPVSGWYSRGIFAGAIVFSLIHFSVYLKGGQLSTTLVIMSFAFILGLIAGRAKEGGNLGSAIVVHVAFNVGGLAGGILINLLSLAITHHIFVQ